MKNKSMENQQDVFYIDKAIYEEIIEYCKKNLPYEACGLISGLNFCGHTLWKLQNEAKSPSRFSLSEAAVAKTLIEIREKGEELTGIFHSHPHTHAYPSRMDIRYNPYPHLAYLIVSFYTNPPSISGYQMINGVNKLEVMVVKNLR